MWMVDIGRGFWRDFPKALQLLTEHKWLEWQASNCPDTAMKWEWPSGGEAPIPYETTFHDMTQKRKSPDDPDGCPTRTRKIRRVVARGGWGAPEALSMLSFARAVGHFARQVMASSRGL